MTNFAFISTILGLAVYAVFVVLSVMKFGWQESYSSYSSIWPEAYPIHNVNLWSLVTVVVAILIVPAMVERGEGNSMQFLGFFAPLYLMMSGLTPTWETEYEARFVHFAGVIICCLATLVWLLYVCHMWWVILAAVALAGLTAYYTKTWKNSYVFWAEMALFASVYAALFIC